MENEDKITTNAIEAVRSEVTKMSAKMAEEVALLKNQGSAVSTVSGSTGSGGNVGNFASRLMQNTFVAFRIELEGWGCWRNIRGTGNTQNEARQLVSMAKGAPVRLRLDR